MMARCSRFSTKYGEPQCRSDRCAITNGRTSAMGAASYRPRGCRSSPARHPTRPVAWEGRMPPRFANDTERELSRMLDFHGIAWQYEPHTFVLEAGPDGEGGLAFPPPLFLPPQDPYIQMTTKKQALVTEKKPKKGRPRGFD